MLLQVPSKRNHSSQLCRVYSSHIHKWMLDGIIVLASQCCTIDTDACGCHPYLQALITAPALPLIFFQAQLTILPLWQQNRLYRLCCLPPPFSEPYVPSQPMQNYPIVRYHRQSQRLAGGQYLEESCWQHYRESRDRSFMSQAFGRSKLDIQAQCCE